MTKVIGSKLLIEDSGGKNKKDTLINNYTSLG